MKVQKVLCLLMVISFAIVSSSCNDYVYSRDIRNAAEQWMECVENKDADALFEYFSQDIKDNRSDTTMDEIHQLLDYIDGDIVSYKYHSGGMNEKKEKGHIYYYTCTPTFEKVETDSGKTYTINFACHYIYDEKPEHEGLERITVYEDGDEDNELIIGDWYLPQ